MDEAGNDLRNLVRQRQLMAGMTQHELADRRPLFRQVEAPAKVVQAR